MGFFDSDTDVNYYSPRVKKGYSAMQERGNIRSLGQQTLAFPTQQIAGLTDTEQMGQGILSQIAGGGAFQDPRSNPYYLGLRQQNDIDYGEGLAQLRNRQNATGMYNSSGAYRGEADYSAKNNAYMNSILGQLYESERSRDNPYTRMAAISQYGSLPRLLEQARLDAEYNKSVQDLLAPYQYQLPIWQQMVGNEVWTQPTVTSNPSDFSNIASLVGLGTQVMGSPIGSGLASAGGTLANLFKSNPLDELLASSYYRL